jgi:serine/threonine protein kinase
LCLKIPISYKFKCTENKLKMDNYMNKFSNVEKIGEGAYGVVFKALDLESNKKVAIKKIRLEHCDEGIP